MTSLRSMEDILGNSQPTSHIAGRNAQASRAQHAYPSQPAHNLGAASGQSALHAGAASAQPTQAIPSVRPVQGAAASQGTRAIPARQSVAGAMGASEFSAQETSALGGASSPVSIPQQFSSLPTAPSRAVATPSAPSSTEPMYSNPNYGAAAGAHVRDPFEPSTPDPHAQSHAAQNVYAPGSTEPVATRYSENSRIKKKPRFGMVVVCVLALLLVVGFFAVQNGGGTSSVTPAGGVTQSQRESSAEETSISNPGVSQNAATLTVDTSDLVGEKWSNAKKKLEVRGADVASIVVLTDDGKDVWDASNWTVESIAVEDGALTAHLVHDSGSSVSDVLENGAADAAGNALDAAGEAVKSAGETAAEKAAEWLGSLF